MRWKYESIVNSVIQAINSGDYGSSLTEQFLFHLADKIYTMGTEETRPIINTNVIPIIDLTYFPKIYNNIKNRWNEGICN